MSDITVMKQENSTLLLNKKACQTLKLDTPQINWFTHQFWQQKNAITGQARGRGTTLFINYGSDLVLRQYQRGGAIRHLSTNKFIYTGLTNTRPYQELALLEAMSAQQLPVPIGIAGLVQRTGATYSAALLSLRIPQAQDIHALLCQAPLADELWQSIGAAIRQLHNAQVYHHDLNIHNIMLDNDSKVWIIDFDKCKTRTGNGWKQANLGRLLRSLEKESQRCANYHFSPHNWQNLLAGYSDNC
jgi:3-deoxy-D-manno-octulosonic acid kinase